MICADIGEIATLSDLNGTVDKLAEVIIEWNTSMSYKSSGGDKSKEGNCQDFVDAILRKLNIKIDFKGPLGKFLIDLRKVSS